MSWQPPYLHQLHGPDGATVRSIVDDLQRYLRNPTMSNGATVEGDLTVAGNLSVGGNLTVGGKTIPRGIVAKQTLTADGAILSADGVTDMAVSNVPVIQGHTYAIHLHAEVTFADLGFTNDRWVLNCRLNGVMIDRFYNLMPAQAGNTSITADATVYWVAPTTQSTDDFDVFADEVAGDATIQLRGSATTPRTLTVIDLGVL